MFAACCSLYANLNILHGNILAFHSHINVLLFYEMFAINVIDDDFFFHNCLLEIHYFGDKSLRDISVSKPKRMRSTCARNGVVLLTNVKRHIQSAGQFYSYISLSLLASFPGLLSFAFQSDTKMYKNTATVP